MARFLTAEAALQLVPDGATVFVAGSCGEPRGLVEAMAATRSRWRELRVVLPYLLEPLALFAHSGRPFDFVSLHPTPALHRLSASSSLETVPMPYSRYRTVWGSAGIDLDVAFVQVTPPGRHRLCSLGPSVGSVVDAVAAADLVIAQVNPRVPYTFGDGELDVDGLDVLVEMTTPLVEGPVTRESQVMRAIGEAAAALIEPGSTVQFGVGAAPSAIAAALRDHAGLRLHGGMFTPECAALVEGGAVRGTAVAAELIGGRSLFDWVDHNPAVRLVGASSSHDVEWLAGVERFVAVNSVIEVALDGASNAEVINGRAVSGPGGLPDFAQAASRAPHGRSIVAVPSTADRAGVSRIVAGLQPGTVTLPAWLADLVVTEHGVARLRHRSRRERAAAMVAVADPRFRAALTSER
jgi:4-hydroxybutyrate CoA-transferase